MKVKFNKEVFTVFGTSTKEGEVYSSDMLLFGKAYGKDAFLWVDSSKLTIDDDDDKPVAKPRVYKEKTKECYVVYGAKRFFTDIRGNINSALLLVYKDKKFTWIDCSGFVECEKKVEVKKELNIEIKRDKSKKYGY